MSEKKNKSNRKQINNTIIAERKAERIERELAKIYPDSISAIWQRGAKK